MTISREWHKTTNGQGFRDGFLEAGGADATISYISDNAGDGYNMPDEAYDLCTRLYE